MDLTYLSYFDYLFYIAFLFPVLIGLIKGMKKTIYSFITMLVFYAIFFFTLNEVIGFIWTFDFSAYQSTFAQINPDLAAFTSFEDSLGLLANTFLGSTVDLTSSTAHVFDVLTGVIQFGLKLVYTIVYFTVFLLLYKLITAIIYAIFFKGKKGESTNHLMGAVFGTLNGALAVFVMLITLGGFMDVVDSLTQLMDSSTTNTTETLTFEPRENLYEASRSIIEVNLDAPGTDQINDQIAYLKDMVDHYNKNVIVQLASTITVPDESQTNEIPLYLSLFDSVLSFDINDQKVALRYEIRLISDAGLVLFESDFYQNGNYQVSDLTGDEVREIVTILSNSDLITTLLPVAIEVGSQMNELDLGITNDELYAIDYKEELSNFGQIVGTLFDILNGAGFISGQGSLEQIEVDGDTVRDLFSDLGDSSLVVLLSQAYLVPMIEDSNPPLSLIITVPDDLDWKTEFNAIGEVLGEVVDSGASINDITDGNTSVLVNTLSQIDFTVLLSSEIITQALINILSGEAGIEGMNFITVPSDVVWRDTFDNQGQLVQAGELRNILGAVNALSSIVDFGDLSSLDLSIISSLTPDVIDDLFESKVMVATISTLINSLDVSTLPLVFPDDAYDEEGYFTKVELKSLVSSITLILSSSSADVDFEKLLNLTSLQIDTLLSSSIISATVGDYLLQMAGDPLIVPSDVIVSVNVSETAKNVVSKTEIKNILLSVQVLGITDFNSLSFDAGILTSLELIPEVGEPTTLDDAKITTLLGSKIVHATVSNMLLDLAEGTSSVLVVPNEDEANVPIIETVGTTKYVSTSEITSALKALYEIDITDFSSINFEDTSLILDHKDTLLDSAIIQATISKMILDTASSTVIIPNQDESGNDVLIVYSDVTYITSSEISSFMDGLTVLGLTNPSTISNAFDLTKLSDSEDQNTLLSSAILQATISKTLLDLSDEVLLVPSYAEDGLTQVSYTVSGTNYVSKSEIKSLIDAFVAMNFTDLSSFGSGIDSSKFFDNTTALLASSSIQATISNRLINGTNDKLIIPNTDFAGTVAIRVVQSDVTYVTKTELEAIIDALDELNLTDFSSIDIQPSNLFNKNFTIVLSSYSMQATISDVLLSGALDDSAPIGSMKLIVPNYYRENITVGSNTKTQVEATELKKLIEGLQVLNVSDFNGGLSANTITSLSDENLNTILLSGSLHVSVDNMIKGNSNVNGQIPTLALADLYGMNGILITSEILAFKNAAQILSSTGNISDVSVTMTAFNAVSDPNDRDICLDSMIVRNILTDELEDMMTLDDPLDTYWPSDDKYMNNDNTTFLTKAGVYEVLSHYGL